MDIFVQEDVGHPTSEPTALVSEESVDPAIPSVSSEVSTPIVAMVEPEVPIVESFVKSIQPSSPLPLQKVTPRRVRLFPSLLVAYRI